MQRQVYTFTIFPLRADSSIAAITFMSANPSSPGVRGSVLFLTHSAKWSISLAKWFICGSCNSSRPFWVPMWRRRPV